MGNAARLKELIEDKLNLSVRRFEHEIQVPRGRISAAIERDSKLSDETITAIIKRYPFVNGEWILTGKGKMLSDNHVLADDDIQYTVTSKLDAHLKTGSALIGNIFSPENIGNLSKEDIEVINRYQQAMRELAETLKNKNTP